MLYCRLENCGYILCNGEYRIRSMTVEGITFWVNGQRRHGCSVPSFLKQGILGKGDMVLSASIIRDFTLLRAGVKLMNHRWYTKVLSNARWLHQNPSSALNQRSVHLPHISYPHHLI